MFDAKIIIGSLRRTGDKDSKAYKITKYYIELTSGLLDDGGIVLASSKVKNIENELKKWVAEHPNSGTIMQPEESALALINDLRKRNLLK